MEIYGVNKNMIVFKCSSKQGLNTRKNCVAAVDGLTKNN